MTLSTYCHHAHFVVVLPLMIMADFSPERLLPARVSGIPIAV